MTGRTFNVLFLCTGKSARSVLAEAILNKIGHGKFRAYSAGSQPKGEVNPNTIKLLDGLGYETSHFSSKSWSEFAKPDAPQFDFIFTVCDDAAGETCPVWPGKPATAHWGIADPAAVKGSEVEVAQAFQQAYRYLFNRIELFTALPFDSLDQMALSAKLKGIGRIEGATGKAKQE
jgi:arsenate reductase